MQIKPSYGMPCIYTMLHINYFSMNLEKSIIKINLFWELILHGIKDIYVHGERQKERNYKISENKISMFQWKYAPTFKKKVAHLTLAIFFSFTQRIAISLREYLNVSADSWNQRQSEGKRSGCHFDGQFHQDCKQVAFALSWFVSKANHSTSQ